MIRRVLTYLPGLVGALIGGYIGTVLGAGLAGNLPAGEVGFYAIWLLTAFGVSAGFALIGIQAMKGIIESISDRPYVPYFPDWLMPDWFVLVLFGIAGAWFNFCWQLYLLSQFG